MAIWSAIEINVGITCASVPALKPLIVRWFPGLLPSTVRSRTGRTGFQRNDYGKPLTLPLKVDAKEPGITIEQTIEMHAVPAANDRKPSCDGSEKALVEQAGWHTAECSAGIGDVENVNSRQRMSVEMFPRAVNSS